MNRQLREWFVVDAVTRPWSNFNDGTTNPLKLGHRSILYHQWYMDLITSSHSNIKSGLFQLEKEAEELEWNFSTQFANDVLPISY